MKFYFDDKAEASFLLGLSLISMGTNDSMRRHNYRITLEETCKFSSV